ncbi:MAG TPA: hypothetical protein RMG48_13395 [Myxococcales bacterium LLY-WYZ-16_1]|nr:hypothetical protein [Myxococcales bacterium LLY-WYZ-16_1]
MSEQPKHTVHAQQALDLSEVFAHRFRSKQLGNPPRSLRLNEPDGPSTAGGRQARQSMVLVNEPGDAVVVGWVDVAAKTAELRSFPYVANQYRARRGQGLDVPQPEYEGLLAEVESFLRTHKVDVRRADQAPASTSPTPSPVPTWSRPGWGVLLAMGGGVLLGVVVGYLVFGG